MANRCPECHNEYPSWSPGVCPTCAKISMDNKRYGTRHKTARQKYGRMVVGPKKSTKKTPVKNIEIKTSPTLKSIKKKNQTQIEAFNRLFEEILGRKYYFSEGLKSEGVSPGNILDLKNDHLALEDYLKRFRHLLKRYIENLPGMFMFQIIDELYGLNGKPPRTEEELSAILSISRSQISSATMNLVDHFKRENGLEIIKDLIKKAYIEEI